MVYLARCGGLSILLVILLLSNKAMGIDIDGVCSKAQQPTFCKKFLGSDPRVATKDPRGAAEILVASARRTAAGMLKEARSLAASSAKEPRIKEVYTSCAENYEGAVSDLDDAQKSLQQDHHQVDPQSANIQVSGALTAGSTCEDDLKEFKANNPSFLNKTLDFQSACASILLIINMI